MSFDPTCELCADWNAHSETTSCHRCGTRYPSEPQQVVEGVTWRAVAEREHSLQKAALLLRLEYAEALRRYEAWLQGGRRLA